MIRESFCFLPGVGQARESALWTSGIHDWNSFLNTYSVRGISSAVKKSHNTLLSTARERLIQDDSEWFAAALPRQHHWRLYDHYRDEAAFLDIETDGWDVTVVGLYDRRETHTFVRGVNLDRTAVEECLSRSKVIITFNGASFDLPVLRSRLGLSISVPHIDLRRVCAKVGLTGGLKSIERQLGLRRALEVQGMDGNDAVLLWQQYRRTGNGRYLSLLLQYNEEDVINLPRIADKVVPELWKRTRHSGDSPFGALLRN